MGRGDYCAASNASMTAAGIRPRGDTVWPLPAAQSRISRLRAVAFVKVALFFRAAVERRERGVVAPAEAARDFTRPLEDLVGGVCALVAAAM